MIPVEHRQAAESSRCGCFSQPNSSLAVFRELGMDDHYAEVSLLACAVCGQVWLRYFYELEAFTASGRWYLGAIDTDQVPLVSVQNSKAILEALDWYFYGGSYFRGKSGQSSGTIYLNP